MPIQNVASQGEKWVKLLRAYSPVADNEAMQAEHVDKLAGHLGIAKLYPSDERILTVTDC